MLLLKRVPSCHLPFLMRPLPPSPPQPTCACALAHVLTTGNNLARTPMGNILAQTQLCVHILVFVERFSFLFVVP